MEHFEKMMSLVVKPVGSSPVYNCMLAIKDERNGLNFSAALGVSGETGKTISAECCFRTGSITKLFTAAVILQLAEEGLLNLEDLYFDLINPDAKKILSGLHFFEGIEYSEKISLLHLLQHRSGLCDYFSDDKRFLEYVIEHPSQSWSWKLVIEKYFEFGLNKIPAFVPGGSYHYSDTNYLLLAVLIEQITGNPLQRVYREKIITPLNLKDTYLEFFELPEVSLPVIYPYYSEHSLENVNTSFDWGGGGLMSTMNDLNKFMPGLIGGKLFKNPESRGLMMQFQNTGSTGKTNRLPQYGLGIQKKEFPGYTFVGHSSAYGSMLYYEPEKKMGLVLSLNQAAAIHKAEWLMNKVVESLP